jgi:hypothetical protein
VTNAEDLDRIRHNILKERKPVLYRFVEGVVGQTVSSNRAINKIRRLSLPDVPEFERDLIRETMVGAARHLFRVKEAA